MAFGKNINYNSSIHGLVSKYVIMLNILISFLHYLCLLQGQEGSLTEFLNSDFTFSCHGTGNETSRSLGSLHEWRALQIRIVFHSFLLTPAMSVLSITGACWTIFKDNRSTNLLTKPKHFIFCFSNFLEPMINIPLKLPDLQDSQQDYSQDENNAGGIGNNVDCFTYRQKTESRPETFTSSVIRIRFEICVGMHTYAS